MSKYKELVYICLDLAKELSDDSTLNENHVMFLLAKHRAMLLTQKYNDIRKGVSTSNYQTICLDLELVEMTPECQDMCLVGTGPDKYLKSKKAVPALLNAGNPRIVGDNLFKHSINFVPAERFEFIGNNQWLKNIIYATFWYDSHIYIKSLNENFLTLDRIHLSALFEDIDAAYELMCCDGDSCALDGCSCNCNKLERDFPIEEGLVTQLIALVLKDVLGASMRPKDSVNNAADDLSNLVNYIGNALKERYGRNVLGKDE